MCLPLHLAQLARPQVHLALADLVTQLIAEGMFLDACLVSYQQPGVRQPSKNWSRWDSLCPCRSASALKLLEAPAAAPRVIFLAPLDSLLWDRRGGMQLFDFEYVWEVYKPEPLRRWGYYVLPVFYGDRFVARLDSRLEQGSWTITHWWWEPDVTPTADLLPDLHLPTHLLT